jgi:hypothetical protein
MGANFSKRKQKNTEKMTGDSNVISNDEKLCVSNENSIPRASLCYFVHLDSTKEPKAPPKLSRLHQNTRSSIEDISELTMMADSLEEKQFIATILREENLYVKGKCWRGVQKTTVVYMKVGLVHESTVVYMKVGLVLKYEIKMQYLQGTRFLDPSFRMEYDYEPISVLLNKTKYLWNFY